MGGAFGKQKTGPLFVSQRGGPLSPRSLNRIVTEAGALAGVKNPNPTHDDRVTPHLFRHSFARISKARGGAMESLANILGHSSAATGMDLYGTESVDDVQENYEKVAAELFA